jgi:hypothetical protein
VTSDFSRISRDSRVLLIPINRPPNIKENTQALGEESESRSRRVLVFLSSFNYFLYVYNFSTN